MYSQFHYSIVGSFASVTRLPQNTWWLFGGVVSTTTLLVITQGEFMFNNTSKGALAAITVLCTGVALGVAGCAGEEPMVYPTGAPSLVSHPAKSTAAPTASPTVSPAASANNSDSAGVASANGLDVTKHSLSKDGSQWQIVNKSHPFQDKRFVPNNLVSNAVLGSRTMRKDAAAALTKMATAAKADGITLRAVSAYRSYRYQKQLYASYAAKHGAKAADRFSARPGFSEHQTGFATDLGQAPAKCDLQDCFGDTPAGKWLDKNSWKYGFILRFPKDGEDKTGYIYEPWHFRYLGLRAAKAFHESDVDTLEDFFGVSGGLDYAK